MNDNDTLADDLRKDSLALMALLEAEKRKSERLEAALKPLVRMWDGWDLGAITPVGRARDLLATLETPPNVTDMAGSDRDPNRLLRWICPSCTTVNGIGSLACVGCRKPKSSTLETKAEHRMCPICKAGSGAHLVTCERWELLGITAETALQRCDCLTYCIEAKLPADRYCRKDIEGK